MEQAASSLRLFESACGQLRARSRFRQAHGPRREHVSTGLPRRCRTVVGGRFDPSTYRVGSPTSLAPFPPRWTPDGRVRRSYFTLAGSNVQGWQLGFARPACRNPPSVRSAGDRSASAISRDGVIDRFVWPCPQRPPLWAACPRVYCNEARAGCSPSSSPWDLGSRDQRYPFRGLSLCPRCR